MDNSEKITQAIIQDAITLPDQAGRDRTVLKEQAALDIALKSGRSLHDVHLAALKKKILPYRYIRNLDSITIDDQLKLFQSKVSIIGAGGLGGEVIILLARFGIGNLAVADHDVFDETNLNRQALSRIDTIGKSKAVTAKDTVGKINPAVNVIVFHTCLSASNADDILTGSDVIIDALDNVSDRFTLGDFARKFGVPLVHGAVAGFEGQLMTIFPEDKGMELIYGKNRNIDPTVKTPALILGVPTVTPAIIASYQVMEAVKIILKKENLFRNMLVYMDLEKCETRKLKFRKD